MKNLLLVIISCFLFSGSLWALPIKDPNKLLDSVDAFLSGQSFAQSFQVDDWADFQSRDCNYSCDESGDCHQVCGEWETSSSKVFEVSPDHAIVGNTGEDEGLVISRELFEASNGNFLRFWLSQNDESPQNVRSLLSKLEASENENFISIESLEYGETALDDGSTHKDVTVSMTVYFWEEDLSGYIGFPLSATLLQRVPGIAQVAHFGFTSDSGTHLLEFGRN